jgi:hypothetical protein
MKPTKKRLLFVGALVCMVAVSAGTWVVQTRQTQPSVSTTKVVQTSSSSSRPLTAEEYEAIEEVEDNYPILDPLDDDPAVNPILPNGIPGDGSPVSTDNTPFDSPQATPEQIQQSSS